MGIVGWLLGWKPRAPERLRIKEVQYFLDGGTTVILGWDRWWRRRSITLTQHLFEDNDFFGMQPGRLYLGGYLVPMRSALEQDIITLLRRCVAELREQPQPVHPAPPAEAAGSGQGGRAVLFGSAVLAALYRMSPQQQEIRHLERVIAYVESEEYGKITGTE
jgi:hypothetical protein